MTNASDLRDDVRTDLENELFGELESVNITLYTLSSNTTNKWGDESLTFSESTISAIPYNQGNVKSWEKYGTLQSEVIEMFVRYTVGVNVNDILLFDGIYYGVGTINKYPLGDGNLITNIVLYKHENQSAPLSQVVYIVDENTNLLVDENNNTIIA